MPYTALLLLPRLQASTEVRLVEEGMVAVHLRRLSL